MQYSTVRICPFLLESLMSMQMKYCSALAGGFIFHLSSCTYPLACAFVSPVSVYDRPRCRVHQLTTCYTSRKRRSDHDLVPRRISKIMDLIPTMDMNMRRFFNIEQGVRIALASTLVGLALVAPVLSSPSLTHAADRRQIGEISASGLLFKVRAYELHRRQILDAFVQLFSGRMQITECTARCVSYENDRFAISLAIFVCIESSPHVIHFMLYGIFGPSRTTCVSQAKAW